MIHLEGMGAQLGKQPESKIYSFWNTDDIFSLKQTRIQTRWEIEKAPNYAERGKNASSKVLTQHHFKANSCGLVREVLFFSLYL